MTAPRPHRPPGFSLLELVIALGISLIVIAGAVSLIVAQQRYFDSTAASRNVQETARVALGHVGDNLRQAGFGVDPALAFDLGPLAAARMDRAPGGQTFATTSVPSLAGPCTTLCRDSTTEPDELVFYARDPAFGPHPLTVAAAPDGGSLTFALLPGRARANVQAGQLLQVACLSGDMSWAYVTATGNATANGDGTATVPIAAGTTGFPNQTSFLADPCFRAVATMSGGEVVASTLTTAAEVFKVDRYRYFVQSYDAAGTPRPWNTPNTRPYLMFDQGLTAAAPVPVAADVEDLQVAYVFPNDPVTPIVGATVGQAITSDEAGIDLAPPGGAPVYSDPLTSPTRQNHHPGNIGAVRVAIVVRTPSAAPGLANASTIPAAGNRAALAGDPGFLRLLVDTTIAVPNLSTLAPYFPSYGTYPASSGNRQLNVGGG